MSDLGGILDLMDTVSIIIALVAFVAGGGLGYFFAQRGASPATFGGDVNSLSQVREDAATARVEASRAREEAAVARSELAQERTEKADLRTAAMDSARQVAQTQVKVAEISAERAKAEAERDAAQRMVRELEADRDAMADQFKLLSEQSLESQSAKADKVAEERMAATARLVSPLAESLRSMNERLTEVEKERTRLAAELAEQVRHVQESGESIRKEALSLATALRTPQVRGAWGEQSLRRIVEIAGMKAHCDFDEQASYKDDEGNQFRPDMRVNLADARTIFVDSKVPLAAILDAYNTEDTVEQKRHVARFGKHVKTHIEQLGGKKYWQLDLRSPDFVVLFLGSDEFLRLALESTPDLYDYAAKRGIVLASPGLLIPLLRTIAHGWRQAELAESAEDIIRLGRELFDRLVTMGGHFEKLGRSLSRSVKDYNSAVSSMEKRVMVSARRFNDLQVADREMAVLETIDEPLRVLSVPEMLAYEDERKQIVDLSDRRMSDHDVG